MVYKEEGEKQNVYFEKESPQEVKEGTESIGKGSQVFHITTST